MACQLLKKQKGTGMKWASFKILQVAVLFLGHVLAHSSVVAVGEDGIGYGKQGYGLRRMPYKSLTMKQQRRLKAPGNEILPAVGSNDISEEPTCEELRAMWRYYKRQSRAEFTNEISQFGKNPFFDMFPSPPHTPVLSSFGPVKGRSKSRMRPQNPLYGRVVYKPSKQKERGGGRNRNPKPFEIVRDMMKNKEQGGGGGSSEQRGGSSIITQPVTQSPREPIIHLSPPPRPTKESSFEKLKQVFREERLREKGPVAPVDNREFGKIVLSPPSGQDGRRANKPRELMTAFEKIRFGHADDLLDEGIRPNLDVMKRRTFPPHVLKQQLPQWKEQQQFAKRRIQSHPMLLLPSSSSPQQASSLSSSYFGKREHENNNQIANSQNDKQQLDSFYEILSVPSFPQQDNPQYTPNLDDSNAGSFLVSKLSNPLETVEVPTCAEVEHDSCNQTSDCSCIGFALYRCYLNQCQILPLAFSDSSNEDNWQGDSPSEIWHSDPLPSEKLGIWEEPDENASRLNTQERKQNEGKASSLTDGTYILLQER